MTSPFIWKGQPSVIRIKPTTRPAKPFNGLRDATSHPNSITVTGHAQGVADTLKRMALQKGGI